MNPVNPDNPDSNIILTAHLPTLTKVGILKPFSTQRLIREIRQNRFYIPPGREAN